MVFGCQGLIVEKEHTFVNYVKAATSRFAYFEKLSLTFSSSSFVIRVNLLHP